VPDILNANANPDLGIEFAINSYLVGLRRELKLRVWCREEEIPVAEAYTGCVSNDVDRRLDLFREALDAPPGNGTET